MICEYMLVREAGKKVAPSWVEDGGYFLDPDNFTMVGWVSDLGVRDWYVPDTVVELTPTALQARVADIHSRHNMTDEEGNAMTTAQVEAIVDAWVAARS
jgi:hypothetical protein